MTVAHDRPWTGHYAAVEGPARVVSYWGAEGRMAREGGARVGVVEAGVGARIYPNGGDTGGSSGVHWDGG